jgi:ADP-heptose:LPS heptosyltransferase
MLLAQSSPSLQEKQSGGRMQLAMISRSFRSPRQLLCAHATEALAPMLRMGSRLRTGSSTSPERWRKGLLIGANHIGDILYRTSSLTQLAKGLPECSWDILAPEPAAQVLEENPAIRRIHRMEIPHYGSTDFKRLKMERYDVAICYDSGSYARSVVTAALLGIPSRVGYVHKGLSGLITHPIKIDYPQAYPAYFRDLVSQITGQMPEWDLRPEIFLKPEDELKAIAFLREIPDSGTIPLIACFITTRQPSGVWPLEKFRETLELLHASTPVRVVLCGALEDRERLEALQASLSFQAIVNAGALGLRPLVAFLKHCRVVLSTDSGPRHLGNAAGVPVVYLRNLRSSATETGNYLDSEYDLAPEGEFFPPSEQHALLGLISPQAAADQLINILRAS